MPKIRRGGTKPEERNVLSARGPDLEPVGSLKPCRGESEALA